MSKWVKATTPPDSDRLVLVCPGVHRQVTIGRYHKGHAGGHWTDGTEEWNGAHIGTVSYWMPLPKAPKGAPTSDPTEWEVSELPSFLGQFANVVIAK